MSMIRPALSCTLVALAASGCALTDPKPATIPDPGTTSRPNIVFILADDLGFGDLGCYGQKKMATPEIDTLASQGLRFTQVYAGSTVCSPSRSVLMTGQHTGHTRVRNNTCKVGGVEGGRADKVVRRMNLTADDVTVADVLASAGYRTGIVGKWHLSGYDPEAGPLNRGFDEFQGTLTHTNGITGPAHWPSKWWDNAELVEVPENADGAQGRYRTDMVTDAAVDFMTRHRDEPFFLYVAFNSPHTPYTAPDLGPYADLGWPEPEATYAAMVHHLDRSVGRLLDTLDELELADDTVVFFASDNGARSEEELVQNRVVEFFDSSGPLRGFKRDLTDGGIRTPMIVRWPGRTPIGVTSDAVWYFADVLPTLAELGGAETPDGIDGISVVAALTDPQHELPDRFLYWEYPQRGFRQAVRWRNWKAMRDGLVGELRLYDVVNDVGETGNVAAEHPDVVEAIEAYLATARTASPNWPVEGDPPLS